MNNKEYGKHIQQLIIDQRVERKIEKLAKRLGISVEKTEEEILKWMKETGKIKK